MKRSICLLMAAVLPALTSVAQAEGPFRNPDNKSANDAGEGTYPVPYKMPVVAEITASLQKVRDFVDRATPTSIVNRKTGQVISPGSAPVAEAALAPSPNDFHLMAYEMGVVHAGLLNASAVTGDPRFSALTAKHLNFIKDSTPYFRAQEERFKLERGNSFARFLKPDSLDDSGSMCAAMMRARVAKVGPDMSAAIAVCSDWVANKQVRLPDGTLARNRPQAWSLWGDDMYMGIPALAEMGRMTGERRYFDDAVNNAMNMTHYLFNPQMGLYAHGWHANNPDAPQFYWGRANGWALLAMSDLLDVLPKDHPRYQELMAQFKLTVRGISQYQSGTGLWHQMLDRPDSYLETSASAIFVYAIAHGVNQGWLSPTTYGSIAQAGWAGLSTRINAQGGVEGTCVGTTLAGDQVYYYNRPASADAMHGYGPMLLAGAEMIKLITNPDFTISIKLRTYHYIPKKK